MWPGRRIALYFEATGIAILLPPRPAKRGEGRGEGPSLDDLSSLRIGREQAHDQHEDAHTRDDTRRDHHRTIELQETRRVHTRLVTPSTTKASGWKDEDPAKKDQTEPDHAKDLSHRPSIRPLHLRGQSSTSTALMQRQQGAPRY